MDTNLKSKVKLLALLPFLIFCSCKKDKDGWDSSGGLTKEVAPIIGDDRSIKISTAEDIPFFVTAPQAYPHEGTSTIISTEKGDIVKINTVDLDSTSDLNNLSNEDALLVVQSACDETATSIDSIDVKPTHALVTWINENAAVLTLSISEEFLTDYELRLIECLKP